MVRTASEITAEQLVVYRAAARQREARQRLEQADRMRRARALAHRAARLLKEQFEASQAVRQQLSLSYWPFPVF